MAGPGRPPGSLNKATAELKALAQVHGPDAIARLVRLMTHSKSEQTRIAAIKELLDRGYGRATQMIAGDEEHPVTVAVDRSIEDVVKVLLNRLHALPKE